MRKIARLLIRRTVMRGLRREAGEGKDSHEEACDEEISDEDVFVEEAVGEKDRLSMSISLMRKIVVGRPLMRKIVMRRPLVRNIMTFNGEHSQKGMLMGKIVMSRLFMKKIVVRKLLMRNIIIIIIIINPLTARVVGAPQMILQPGFSIFFLFSTALWDLPNSRPVHSLMLS